jgi:penicillin-binding protein 1A
VLKVGKRGVKIGLRPRQKNKSSLVSNSVLKTQTGFIPLSEIVWAREQYADDSLGLRVKHPKQVLEEGDIIYVEPLTKRPKPDPMKGINLYSLRQLPQVNGGILAMNPHNGKILAMTGGFSFAVSEFNRATQAWRQPGSAIKPFVYAAALDSGFTPISKIMDAPFVGAREEQFLWKPENYEDNFKGPTLLRKGIELSRNLMTVHLTNEVGLGKVMDYTKRFGVAIDIRPELSLALGAEETTLLRLTAAYARLANGGKDIKPYAIERIQDRFGRTIYRNDKRQCKKCLIADGWRGEAAPVLQDTRPQIISPQTIYQIVSMMQGVIKRGTGTKAGIRGMTLAGKTGTTNKERDAWFVGFTPDLVVGVYVGFDSPKPMGKKETGGLVAAPIFADFMKQLDHGKAKPFRIPPGITLVRIDKETGKAVGFKDRNTIEEAFKTGTEPGNSNQARSLRQDPIGAFDETEARDDFSGTGGLY